VRDVETIIGGSHNTQSAPISIVGAIRCSQKRGAMKKTINWTDATLKQATDAITYQKMKVRVVVCTFGIPTSSLMDHLYDKVMERKRGAKTMLSQEEEGNLLDYYFKMQNFGHTLTSGQLRLKVAMTTQTRETPWNANGVLGKSWLRSFKLRHPDLVSRKSQPLEMGKARGLCPISGVIIYYNLHEIYGTFNYSPSNIWNCDESEVHA
jgi:hypothetical protein